MATDLNRTVLIGRLTREPELKATPGGAYVCRITLASNRTIYQRDAEPREEVGFFDCVAWGKLAEVVSKYAHKGSRIAVDGHLRFSSWENQEGRRQSKVEIFVENFQLLEPKPQNELAKPDQQANEPNNPEMFDDRPF